MSLGILLGGYRSCKVVPCERVARATYYSIEKLIGEISTDGKVWKPFERQLWRRSDTGEKLGVSWWDLAEKGEVTALDLLLPKIS